MEDLLKAASIIALVYFSARLIFNAYFTERRHYLQKLVEKAKELNQHGKG